MILLFTDFGAEGPYLGQMQAVLQCGAPTQPIINLLSNAPAGEPELASYLLAALARQCPSHTVLVCVVDPGVGGERLAVALEADGRWYVGPDNGLLNTVARQARQTRWRIIEWRPEILSSTFHGRDLFAPIAARISLGDFSWAHSDWSGPDLRYWPADRAAVIYCDHYGNAMTGVRYRDQLAGAGLIVNGRRLEWAETFCRVAPGEPFWYCNSAGLVEIAVNRGRADRALELAPGTEIRMEQVRD
ncbi:MAG: SAM-dependent chlorinase/fluorinase [Methylococcaceae bacterium]|nr:SAM-dependent chlorinase/fluorinase [Methylococcaceae bacterium]